MYINNPLLYITYIKIKFVEIHKYIIYYIYIFILISQFYFLFQFKYFTLQF